jgi:hypothetical protein
MRRTEKEIIKPRKRERAKQTDKQFIKRCKKKLNLEGNSA